MQKNKIIDKLYKKLLKEKFSHDDIATLINLEKEFSQFENYIYYLFSISLKKYNEQKFIMAKSINKYLEYLVNQYKIEQLTIDKLKPYQNLSTLEIYLLGARGFDGLHPFTFDVDDNCYVALNDHAFTEYKGIINIALCSHNDSFLKSLINQRLINHNYNEIYVFKKLAINYEFLGSYKIKDINQVYQNDQAFPSLILSRKDMDEESSYLEYLNLNNRNFNESFNTFKNNIRNLIIINRNDTYRFLNIIDDNHCHYILLYNLVQHVLTINDQPLLAEIISRYKLMLKQCLMLPLIIPEKTIIDEYYLSIFSDTYDILYGMQINADYMHNIYMVIDAKNFEQQDINNINIRFVKSFGKHFFDLDINKKIFNTVTQNTAIYLFIKDERNIIYHGMYKVAKLKIGLDLQNQKTPIFSLRQLSIDEKLKHFVYINQTYADNAYKNAFISFAENREFNHWIKDRTLISPTKINHENNMINSILYKFNWVVNCCLNNSTNEKFKKYWTLFYKFNNKHLLNIINCVNYKYQYIIEHKLMQPWTIAYQMTKQNFSSKGLFDISYVDFYQTKNEKYAFCLSVLNKK